MDNYLIIYKENKESRVNKNFIIEAETPLEALKAYIKKRPDTIFQVMYLKNLVF